MTLSQLWLVCLPNQGASPDKVFSALSAISTNDCGTIHRFETPALVVGTLDSLVALSDELIKLNLQVENVVRKVERQYTETAGPSADTLRINEMTVESYLRKFSWDFARYRHQGRQLSEIVNQIHGMATKVDEELKKLTLSYTEKQQMVSGLQRKKTINLSTSDLEDVIPPEKMATFEFLNSETLLTVLVAVPAALEQGLFISMSNRLTDPLRVSEYVLDSWRRYRGVWRPRLAQVLRCLGHRRGEVRTDGQPLDHPRQPCGS